MRLWSRFVAVAMALALAFSLSAGTANAASKKKKKEMKKEAKKEMKKEAKREARHEGGKSVIAGPNSFGRPGLFLADSASTPEKNQLMGAAGLQFFSQGSFVQFPFGVAYGITDQIQVHASSNLVTQDPSGLTNFTFGGKYAFKNVTRGLNIGVGLDLSIAPLNIPNVSGFNFDPYGIVTYVTPDGLLLNGQLGVMVLSGQTITIGGLSFTTPSTSYVQLNMGAAYPFDRDLTGIAEVNINGYGSGATPMIVGIRTGHDVQLSLYGGLDAAANVGLILGGTVGLVSQ